MPSENLNASFNDQNFLLAKSLFEALLKLSEKFARWRLIKNPPDSNVVANGDGAHFPMAFAFKTGFGESAEAIDQRLFNALDELRGESGSIFRRQGNVNVVFCISLHIKKI